MTSNNSALLLASPEQTARAFRYDEALDKEKLEIRILTVYPGTFEQPLTTSIRVESLSSRPYLEALSHVWGDESITKDIIVNGGVKAITVNLESALRHLRFVDRPRDLWVDAICINQDKSKGLKEKEWQLPLMADIYSNSALTVVWLGESNAELDVLYRCIRDTPEQVDLDELVKPSLSADEAKIARSLIHAVFRFGQAFQSSWWSRCWTLQEVVLPRNDPIIVCGDNVTTWSHYWHCADLAYIYWERIALSEIPEGLDAETYELALSGSPASNGNAHSFSKNPDTRRWIRRKWHELPIPRTGYEALSLLHLTRSLEATNPRDKVYSLLGLLDGRFLDSVVIDYAAHPMAIFEVLAQKCWLSESINNFIAFEFSPVCPQDCNRPSWVPDFSSSERFQVSYWNRVVYQHDVRYTSSGSIKETIHSPGLVKIRAVLFDHAAEMKPSEVSREESMYEHIAAVRNFYTSPVQNGQSDNQITYSGLSQQSFSNFFMAYECNPTGFATDLHAIPKALLPTVKKLVYYYLDQGLEDGASFKQYCIEHAGSTDVNMMATYIDMAIARQFTNFWEKALFMRSSQGFWLGGCKNARPGDVIAMISGMTCPMMLRPQDDQTFKVVGAAYVFMMMSGRQVNEWKGRGWLHERDIVLS